MTTAAVVAVAGWALGRESLAPLAAALASPGPIITASAAELLPAAGAAGAPPEEEGRTEALARLIAGTGRPAILLGWSMGALLALETARRSPHLISALILVGATARFCRAPGYPSGTPASLVEAMSARLRATPTALLADFYQRVFLPETLEVEELRDLQATARRQGTDLLARGLDYLATADCRADLARIACPALILHGERDRVIPMGAAAYLHQGLAMSRLEIIPGAGHALPLRHAAALGERIRPFLHEL